MRYSMKRYFITLLAIVALIPMARAQYRSEVWQADCSDGTYRNPIIHADYSDPDVVRVGDDYYMTASSFNCVPALPILHSKDLVNWTIVNYALPRLEPETFFAEPQHGKGVWAPCIKYHDGEYYIYWGDPDFGIYMVKTSDPMGEWQKPVLVKAGKGLIDPSPLWDDNGEVYLAHAWAASRSGVNSIITISRMNAEGTACIGDEVMVFDGNMGDNHTVEGAKLYKRDGYYYIFAPAGGVAEGWQLVMRSKSIYGPYEARNVMAQNETSINGPHQGAWIETPSGESWFIHFQDCGTYGRVAHLNPMKWSDDGWCVIGEDKDGDGCGSPIMRHRKPDIAGNHPIVTPQESDEFDSRELGLQWEWHANPEDWFAFTGGYGFLRMYTLRGGFHNMWQVPNLLLQKFPAEEFVATTKVRLCSKGEGDSGGLIVMGYDYARLMVTRRSEEAVIELITCHDADQGSDEVRTELCRVAAQRYFSGAIPRYDAQVWLRVKVEKGGICTFSYSLDGKRFDKCETTFKARVGKWIGAKVGLCCVNEQSVSDRGWIDVDWFRIGKK